MNELERIINGARREEDSKSLDSFLIFVLFLFVFLLVILPIIAFKGYIKDKREAMQNHKIEIIGGLNVEKENKRQP